jgi:hypothetical protein
MTTDEIFAAIQQQNEIIIGLLARLVWAPDKITGIVTNNKRNPEAYIRVYNALDGSKTGRQLASLADVAQPTMSVMLQSWLGEGIILNVGTDSQPKYKRLMRIPELQKKGKRDTNDKSNK